MKLPLLKRPDPSATGETAAVKKKRPALKKLGRKKLIALVAAAALVIGLGSHALLGGSAQAAKKSDGGYTTAQVTRRDVTATITGSGTLEAADSYNVTTLLEDTILTANFEEGDQVEEGTVLYTLDASDADSSLEQSEISLQQAQRSYSRQLEDQADLNVAATAAGQVWSVDVEVGDEIQAGQTVATIRDSATMELKVPFPADDAASFSLGQSATAAVGSVTSTDSGTFTYSEEKTVTAKVGGTVSRIHVSEGDRVSKNQTLVTLTSSSLSDQVQSASESVRNAQINLENRYEQLDDYTITSPIKGTIIDKNYNAGETTEANKTLCTIYDLSYLTMTLSVDELDISNISVGQTVSITADAVEDQTYTGTVTKVSVAGTSTGGGAPGGF